MKAVTDVGVPDVQPQSVCDFVHHVSLVPACVCRCRHLGQVLETYNPLMTGLLSLLAVNSAPDVCKGGGVTGIVGLC